MSEADALATYALELAAATTKFEKSIKDRRPYIFLLENTINMADIAAMVSVEMRGNDGSNVVQFRARR